MEVTSPPDVQIQFSQTILSNISTMENASLMCPPVKLEWQENGYLTLCIERVNLSEYLQPKVKTAQFIPAIVTYSLTFFIGVFLNLMFIITMYSVRLSKYVNVDLFLISLASADFMFLLICAPYECLVKYSGFLTDSAALCKISSFIEMSTMAASVFNLVVVSYERYVVIVHPIKAREVFTKFKSVLPIVLVWILAAIVSLPTIYIWRISTHVYYRYDEHRYRYYCSNYEGHSRTLMQGYAWYRLLVLYVIPLFVMAFCYIVAIRVLSQSTTSLSQMTSFKQPNNCRDQENGKHRLSLLPSSAGTTVLRREHDAVLARKQLMKMLLTVIALFVISWGPKLIWDVFEEHHRIYTSALFDFSIYVLPYIQSALNPVVYVAMSRTIRTSISNCVGRKHLFSNGSRPSTVSIKQRDSQVTNQSSI